MMLFSPAQRAGVDEHVLHLCQTLYPGQDIGRVYVVPIGNYLDLLTVSRAAVGSTNIIRYSRGGSAGGCVGY